ASGLDDLRAAIALVANGG
ncbi:hypothetical protein, partial [Mesorhizobium sp.]